MRKSILVLTALALPLLTATGQEHARVAWTTPDPDYPLQIRILTIERTHHLHAHATLDDTESYGSGNVSGSPEVGFDFTSWCPGGIHTARHDEFYEGRWKEQNRQLEILTVEVGRNKPDKCVLKVSVKPQPYTKDNPPPHLVTAHQ